MLFLYKNRKKHIYFWAKLRVFSVKAAGSGGVHICWLNLQYTEKTQSEFEIPSVDRTSRILWWSRCVKTESSQVLSSQSGIWTGTLQLRK
jgi:hypothetical protein